MPGLRGRLSSVVKAKTSAALDRAENPSQTLDYSYEKQLELMAGVKKGITEVAPSRKRLENQREAARQQVDKLGEQARQALAAGKEDLRPPPVSSRPRSRPPTTTSASTG